MADEYTPEQKRKIARHFLLVAPHGEHADLARDLKKVVPGNILTDEWLHQSMSEYNKRRFVVAEGDTSKIICCPQGEVDVNKYLQPDKKVVCTVDPVKQKIVEEADAAGLVASGDVDEYRTSMAAGLKKYLRAFYEDGTGNQSSNSRGTGFVFASPQGQIAIVISFKNVNVNNYWTGGWQSEWTLNVDSKGSTKLEGRIRLNVHYYEDGNVQLNSTFNETGEVEVSDPASTAERVINTITTLETDFQQRLEKFYVQMHDSTFKNMRRFLPKIGKKMDWRASVHALTTEVASK